MQGIFVYFMANFQKNISRCYVRYIHIDRHVRIETTIVQKLRYARPFVHPSVCRYESAGLLYGFP